MPESYMMPERLTAILSTPGVCVILRKHQCITSLWGQDESFHGHQYSMPLVKPSGKKEAQVGRGFIIMCWERDG